MRSRNIIRCELFDPLGHQKPVMLEYLRNIGLVGPTYTGFPDKNERVYLEVRDYPSILDDLESAGYFRNAPDEERFHSLTNILASGATIYIAEQIIRGGYSVGHGEISIFIPCENIVSISLGNPKDVISNLYFRQEEKFLLPKR